VDIVDRICPPALLQFLRGSLDSRGTLLTVRWLFFSLFCPDGFPSPPPPLSSRLGGMKTDLYVSRGSGRNFSCLFFPLAGRRGPSVFPFFSDGFFAFFPVHRFRQHHCKGALSFLANCNNSTFLKKSEEVSSQAPLMSSSGANSPQGFSTWKKPDLDLFERRSKGRVAIPPISLFLVAVSIGTLLFRR